MWFDIFLFFYWARWSIYVTCTVPPWKKTKQNKTKKLVNPHWHTNLRNLCHILLKLPSLKKILKNKPFASCIEKGSFFPSKEKKVRFAMGLSTTTYLGPYARTTMTAVKTSPKKWICILSNLIASIWTRSICQMQATFPGVEFLRILFRFKERKEDLSSYVHVLYKTSN